MTVTATHFYSGESITETRKKNAENKSKGTEDAPIPLKALTGAGFFSGCGVQNAIGTSESKDNYTQKLSADEKQI